MRVDRKLNTKVADGQATKPTIHNVHLLDRSGSMEQREKYRSAEQGINEEINVLKSDDTANYTQTIIEFDGFRGIRYNTPMFMIPMNKVEKFVGKGPDGMTPLYEAVAYTINKLITSAAPDDRILLKIFTDGGENDSRNGWGRHEGGAKKLYDLIQKVKNENNVTIAFVGTATDTQSVINDLGIDQGNTLVHDNTGAGTKMSFRQSVGATISYAKSMAAGEETVSNFYSKTVEEN